METVDDGGDDGRDDETCYDEDCACNAGIVVRVAPWVHYLL